MKKKFLSMLMLVCLLITAMPTAFAAADGDVAKTFTAIFHSAMDETKVALEGVESRIELTDGNVAVQKLTDYNTEGTSTCEITYNGDMFVYEYEELEDGKDEPTHYRYEYPYLRVVTYGMPDDYDQSIIDELYTVEEFIEMVGEGDGATVYYPVDTFREEFVASDELTYEIYREYYNGEYGNTSIYYGNADGFNSDEVIDAFEQLEEIDNCINVYVTVWGEGFPTISAEAMTILNEYDAFIDIYNDDTGEDVYWWPASSNNAFELTVAENASVTEGLDTAKIPYVLLSAKGMEGAEELGIQYFVDGGILTDGAYDENSGFCSASKYVYYYDVTNKLFKLCDGEATYLSYKNEESQAYEFAGIMYEGTLPVSGYYVIVDTVLPNALTTVPTQPQTPSAPEVQEVKATWSETKPWTVDVQNVSVGERPMEYYIEIYKDGKYVGYDYCWGYAGDKISFDISHQVAVNGAGNYTVEVEVYENENWYLVYEGTSAARAYAKPATQLATPANVSFDVETGALKFDTVEGAVAYDIWFTESYAGNEHPGFRTIRLESNDTSECDFTWIVEMIDMYKESTELVDICLTIGVCAASENVDNVAYSELAEVVVYEKKLSKEEVKEAFDEAFENVEDQPFEAAAVLDGVSNDTLVEMIKTDADFAQKVEKLDNVLIEELGDGYKGATSKTDVVDASKVKVVGAAINGRFADTVELSFAKPEKEAEVPTGYANGVQLDISLLIDGRAQENLNVPVTITMPIPTGVNTKDLVILHYHGDATEPVVIVPTVNADGTMTFIVDGFSTFVVANQVAEATIPKTGDTSATAMICSLMLLAAGVVLITKRNSFAK